MAAAAIFDLSKVKSKVKLCLGHYFSPCTNDLMRICAVAAELWPITIEIFKKITR